MLDESQDNIPSPFSDEWEPGDERESEEDPIQRGLSKTETKKHLHDHERNHGPEPNSRVPIPQSISVTGFPSSNL